MDSLERACDRWCVGEGKDELSSMSVMSEAVPGRESGGVCAIFNRGAKGVQSLASSLAGGEGYFEPHGSR